ncbi:heavy-metal resistance [Roseovarius mucosus]|uniref:Heavy-metal resistance n=1 Tax=Roseovarius mucosus TaxID=215743 RepID=A0A1V0RSE2_9RHOB|nr:periplasmic heavy metal sensor [Roseovarius mucosus]ARE84565.1 heavy-metal resistance [Roseovarius mucosus]
MTEQQGTGRTKPWVRALLVASLALNLAVAGLAAGWALRHGGDHAGHHPSRLDMAGGPLTRALSDADRRAIGRAMRDAWRNRTNNGPNIGESFDALVIDLRAVPFNADRVAAQMRTQRDGFAARFEMGQEVLLTHLTAMSDADRAAYADRLEAQIAEYRAKREKHRKD